MAEEPRRGSHEGRGSADWDELMKAMLRPTPPSSRCRLAARTPSGAGRSKKSSLKKKKCKERRVYEPKFEFLLCSMIKHVFGCSKEDSSIKIIAKKLKCLESKVNDIEKKVCPGRILVTPPVSPPGTPPRSPTPSPPISKPISPAPSPPKTPPRSPTPSPPKTPPVEPMKKPIPPSSEQNLKKVAATQSEASTVSTDSDEYDIKGLKVKKSTVVPKEVDDRKLKAIHVKPEANKTKKKGRKNSPRYSLDVYRRRPSEVSRAPSGFSNPDAKRDQRNITQFFQEKPPFVDRSPEIEASSSSSIPSYIVETETEHIYVSHGTGQKKLANLHLARETLLKGNKASYFFPVSSSGTFIFDFPSAEESFELPINNTTVQEKHVNNESVFNRVITNENARPVCFESPLSVSSESLKFEHVCVVKSNSLPVIGKKLCHKKN